MSRLAICTALAVSVVPIALAQPKPARSTVDVLSRLAERVEALLRPGAESRQPREGPNPDARPGLLGNRSPAPARVRARASNGCRRRDLTSAPDATMRRRLLKVNGRAARPSDEPGCLDPKAIATEPLAVFLRGRQHEQIFSWTGDARHRRARGRDARLRPPRWSSSEGLLVEEGECVSVDVGARSRGRVWADAETGDVLRLDEWVAGMHEFPCALRASARLEHVFAGARALRLVHPLSPCPLL